MKYIWIELRARLAIAQTLANLKRDNHPEIERLLVLIEHLETHSQQSPFREALVSFRRTVLHSLGLAG